jgi:hypothetical protein
MVITDIYVGGRGGGEKCRRLAPGYTRWSDAERFRGAALHIYGFARRHAEWRGESLKICKDITKFKNTLERGDCEMQLLVPLF